MASVGTKGSDDYFSIVGLADDPYEMDVERGKIREFALATYAQHPAFLEGRTPIVPPTFLTIAEYAWGPLFGKPGKTLLSKIPFDLLHTFDAEEEFTFFGVPPRAGERLSVKKIVERILEKESARSGKLTFVQFLSQFRNASDALIAEMRSSWVKTEKPSEQRPPRPAEENPPSPTDRRVFAPFARLARSQWDELSEGQTAGRVVMEPLTLLEIVRYEGAISGFGPVHFDLATAKEWGYANVYSTGMLHAGALGAYATQWLGPENIRRLKTRFTNIVWLGDRLIYQGWVRRKYEEGGSRKIDAELLCQNDSGDTVVAGTATFAFP